MASDVSGPTWCEPGWICAVAARERFAEFAATWGARYPAIVRLWDNAWAEFVPFLAFDPEIRRVICSTNAIESWMMRWKPARLRRPPGRRKQVTLFNPSYTERLTDSHQQKGRLLTSLDSDG